MPGRGVFPSGGRGGGPFGRGGPPGRGGNPPPDGARGRSIPGGPPAPKLVHLETALKKDCAIIAGKEFPPCILASADAASLVDILTSQGSSEEKRDRIRNELPGHLVAWNWQEFIESFVPSDELFKRLEPQIERLRKVVQENNELHEAAMASIFWTSKPVKYVITLMAMGLVVAACGTLLNHRPIGRARWSEIDTGGDGIPIVVRSVVLLILLGIFDLGCTLVAQQAGGLTEMNPLGERIVQNPLLLTTFKLTTLLTACAILYALRRYRGAQVAAWWMCLLCTVLTFRWLTYNSMFMS
jgi:hypothetical protein